MFVIRYHWPVYRGKLQLLCCTVCQRSHGRQLPRCLQSALGVMSLVLKKPSLHRQQVSDTHYPTHSARPGSMQNKAQNEKALEVSELGLFRKSSPNYCKRNNNLAGAVRTTSKRYIRLGYVMRGSALLGNVSL